MLILQVIMSSFWTMPFEFHHRVSQQPPTRPRAAEDLPPLLPLPKDYFSSFESLAKQLYRESGRNNPLHKAPAGPKAADDLPPLLALPEDHFSALPPAVLSLYHEVGLDTPARPEVADDLPPLLPLPEDRFSSFEALAKRLLEQPAEPPLKRRRLEPPPPEPVTVSPTEAPEVTPLILPYGREPCSICGRWFSLEELKAHSDSLQGRCRLVVAKQTVPQKKQPAFVSPPSPLSAWHYPMPLTPPSSAHFLPFEDIFTFGLSSAVSTAPKSVTPPPEEIPPPIAPYGREPCHICARWFSLEELKEHLKSHRPFKCDFCSKGFSTQSKLWAHRLFCIAGAKCTAKRPRKSRKMSRCKLRRLARAQKCNAQ